MEFIVTGRDGTDPNAQSRRMAAREAHLKLGDELRAAGKMHMAAALLDDSGNMVGSVVICDFADRAELDAWLEREPYVTGGVWQEVDVRPCRIGPSFRR